MTDLVVATKPLRDRGADVPPLSDDGIRVNKIIAFLAFGDALDPGSVVQLDL